MSEMERVSFSNTIKVLAKWDVILILPKNINLIRFEKIRKSEKLNFRIGHLPAGMMGSIEKYNQMCLNPGFYKMFGNYEFILMAHMDAWIFRDDLERWLDSGFDYIGAPLFLSHRKRNILQKVRNKKINNLWGNMIPEVGNGGLCLRRVSTHMAILNQKNSSFDYELFFVYLIFLIRNSQWKYVIIFIKHLIEALKNADFYRSKHLIYEDVFISGVLNLLNRPFKVAPAGISLAFSIETHQKQILTTESRFTLPFGVHGWDKVFTIEEIMRLSKNETLLSRKFNRRFDK
jgi:hypothetical protein